MGKHEKSAIQKAKEAVHAKYERRRKELRGEDVEKVIEVGSDSLADDPVYSNWVRKVRRGIGYD